MEKIKDGGDSCFRDISRTSVKQSVPDPPITVVVLDLELHAKFSDHDIVEVGTIVSYGPLRDVISTDKVMLDVLSHHILGN